ncbi:Capsular polysaccharide type 8 biosynthesis protein cap8A [compost metagenome]
MDQADPSESYGPISPNPKMNIVVAFMLALMVGIAISFLLDYLDDTIKTEEDVEALLGVPVLSSIPSFNEKDAERSKLPLTNTVRRENNVSLDA